MTIDIQADELEEPVFFKATSDHKPAYSDIDISTKAFWAKSPAERELSLMALRESDPVSWQRPVEDAVSPDPDDPGYWAVVRHADIVAVGRDHETFISGQGVIFDVLPPVVLEMALSFIGMDPPRHDHLRRLVSAAFTPKQLARIEEQIVTAAREIVDAIAKKGDIECVSELSSKLPLRVFCDMFGVPEHLRARTGAAAAAGVSWADPEVLAGRTADEFVVEMATEIHEVAEEMIAARRANPTDDLFTSLVQAEVDGERLDDFDIQAFFSLMSVAATDTTKHTTNLALKELTDHPEQRAWLMEDFDGRIKTAVEEFIRWSTPIINFRRTATRETVLNGRTIIPGDKVVLLYASGNRDESVFDDPQKFDLSRSPNPHVSFGGGGIHYCLGHQLAKSMLTAIFREIFTRIPDFQASELEMTGTNFLNNVKRMRLRFTPES
jgi:cytochrome P450